MSPDRQRKVVEILEAALELDGEARGEFIERASGGDPSLRKEVWSLILHDEQAGSFIEEPAFDFRTNEITGGAPEMSEGSSLGPYQIIRHLGEGGMGVVYLARHTKLDRLVALKLLPEHFTQDKDKVRRFEQEARAASKLQHNNIITIYDIARTERVHYIVTEYVDGQTLRERLAGGPVTLEEVLDVIEQVASALKAAHEAGIVHRDIKPENIMIRRDGVVKVLDFGLAKLAEPLPGDSQAQTLFHTRPGVLVGTPNYMSPEQINGPRVDERSDLFALGAVLYECLTGRPAFSGNNPWAVWGQVQNVHPPPPSQLNQRVSPELNRITLKLLAKKSEERYQSAEELLADISAMGHKARGRVIMTSRSTPAGAITSRVIVLTTALSGALRRPHYLAPLIALVLLAVASVIWLAQQGEKRNVWYEKGTEALRNGAYQQARIALERAIKADDEFALAHVRLAEAYIELGNKEKAREELYRFNKLVPDRSKLSQPDRLYVEAVMALPEQDFTGAIKAYSEIARLTPNEPSVYVDLGRVYEKNNEIEQAIPNYERAAKLDPEYATAFLRLGILYGRKQQQPLSDRAFDQAQAIYEAQGSTEGVAEVHFQHGLILQTSKNITAAHVELQRAYDFARAAGNESQQVLSLLQLSSVSFAEGQTQQAQQLARQAVDLAQQKGMQTITIRGLVDLGNAFFVRGGPDDLANAEGLYKEALGYALTFKDRRNEARARFSLGSLRIKRGDIEQGLGDVEQAHSYYKEGRYDSEASLALTLIGQAKRDRGDYGGALAAFAEQLRIAEQVNAPALIASAHKEIGKVLLFQESYPEALKHFDHSLALSQTLSSADALGYLQMLRSMTLWRLGRYEDADSQLDKLATGKDYQGLRLAVILNKAEMDMSRGRFSEAKAKLHSIFDQAVRQGASEAVEITRLVAIAEAYSGNRRNAIQLCSDAYRRAVDSANPWLVSRAQLTLAESMLVAGEEQSALETALEAVEKFGRTGQRESEWRAWSIAAFATRTSNLDRARAYAANARAALDSLERQWGTEAFRSYSTRTDVTNYRQQLKSLTPVP